jgi:hypothetical protein
MSHLVFDRRFPKRLRTVNSRFDPPSQSNSGGSKGHQHFRIASFLANKCVFWVGRYPHTSLPSSAASAASASQQIPTQRTTVEALVLGTQADKRVGGRYAKVTGCIRRRRRALKELIKKSPEANGGTARWAVDCSSSINCGDPSLQGGAIPIGPSNLAVRYENLRVTRAECILSISTEHTGPFNEL